MLGTDQGLASGAVICVTQDREGYLWMGTENGLVRYEGRHSRQWGREDGLPSASVPRILADPGGGVWVGTLRGLVRVREGRFEAASFGGGVSSGPVGDMALDRRGRLWTYTWDGLVRQTSGLDFEFLPWKTRGSVYGITAGPRSGNIYVAGQHGIQVFQEDGGTLSWGAAQGLPAKGPTLVIEDGQGRVWAGSGATLAMKAPGQAVFTDQSHRLPAPISPNGLPTLDRDGSVWIPTQNGVQQMDGERLDAAHGLPFRWVRSLFRDREGSFWVLGPGIAHLQGDGRLLNYRLSQGESGEVVWSMIRDARGRMLAGTDNGVVALEPGGPRRIPGTSGWRIKGMALDREGTLWMVNTRGPTLWLRPGAAAAEVAPLGEAGVGANSVLADAAGRVWIGGTMQGVQRWDPRSRRLVQEVPPSFVQARILGIYEFHEDGQGRLWAGADGGILVREPQGAWAFHRAPGGLRVRGMALLPDGTAWIHHEEPSGILRVRLGEGALEILERRGRGWGLNSNLVYGVRLDTRGALWVATDKGLDRVHPPLHLGSHEGMASEDCSISALLVEEDQVWVGTSGGLVRYDASGATGTPGPPRAGILQLTLGNRKLEPPFPVLPPLPYDQSTVELRVAAPSYQNDGDLRFQVRLLGLEEGWRDLEGRTVRYPGLPPKRYRFEVRAAQAQGSFGPATSLEFRVRPPWWRTGWVYALDLLGGILALAGTIHLRERALARKQLRLEATVAERTRELTERNAELAEALGNVRQLTGLLPICAHCKKIRDDQGYWNQLENYLSRHSGVGFSHGICPQCAREHFPDLHL
jgi:ligand-binding sensor domain-containing protein